MQNRISGGTHTGRTLEAKEIVSGTLVNADTVKVHTVSTGAVVIADEVRDLETVQAGGVIVSPQIKSEDYEIHHTGYHFTSIEEYIQHLHNEISDLDLNSQHYDSKRERLENKLEAVKQYR